MTDEIKKNSVTPYFLTGAAIGGVGTGIGLTKVDSLKQYITEPKYSSYADILAESHDELVKQSNVASEESKGAWDKIAAARKEIDGKAAEWENMKNEYVQNNSVAKVVEDTDEIKNLTKDLEELKANVAKKENQYFQEEVEKLSKNEVLQSKNTNNEGVEKGIKNIEEKIAEAKKGREMATNTAKSRTQLLNNKIDELAKTIPDSSRSSANAVEQAEKNLKNIIDSFTDLTQAERDSLFRESKIELQARTGTLSHVRVAEQRLANAKSELESINQKIKVYSGNAESGKEVNFVEKYAQNPDGMKKLIENDKNELANLNKKYDTIQRERKAHIRDQWAKRQEARKSKVETRHTVEFNGQTLSGTHTEEKVFKYEPWTPSKENKEILDSYKKQSSDLKTRIKAREKVFKLQEEVKDAQAKLDGVRSVRTSVDVPVSEKAILDSDKKVLNLEKVLKNLKGSGNEAVDNTNLEKQAKEAVEKRLASEKANITKLAEDIAAKRNALPKQTVKTAEELAEEFAKKTPKSEFIKEATESATKNLKDDLAKAMKDSTRINNKKLWMFIAGGAVAVGLLASLFSPKHKKVSV